MKSCICLFHRSEWCFSSVYNCTDDFPEPQTQRNCCFKMLRIILETSLFTLMFSPEQNLYNMFYVLYRLNIQSERKTETRLHQNKVNLDESAWSAPQRWQTSKYLSLGVFLSSPSRGAVSTTVSVSIGRLSLHTIYPWAGVPYCTHNKWQVRIIGQNSEIVWAGWGDFFCLLEKINIQLWHLNVDFDDWDQFESMLVIAMGEC